METIISMEEQLAEFYGEKEHLNLAFPGFEVRDLIEASRSVQSQLESLISDQVDALLIDKSKLDEALPGLTIEHVIELAKAELDRREHDTAGSDLMVSSLSEQLSSLYTEREELETVFPGRDIRSIVTEIQDKIKLLAKFYSRKS